MLRSGAAPPAKPPSVVLRVAWAVLLTLGLVVTPPRVTTLWPRRPLEVRRRLLIEALLVLIVEPLLLRVMVVLGESCLLLHRLWLLVELLLLSTLLLLLLAGWDLDLWCFLRPLNDLVSVFASVIHTLHKLLHFPPRRGIPSSGWLALSPLPCRTP